MMQRLFFKPIDVLFFRDARPNHAGEAFSARSVFPSPSVFYGALRSYLLEKGGIDFERYRKLDVPEEWDASAGRDIIDTVGTPRRPGKLRMRGPFLCKGENLFFPAPRDLIRFKEEGISGELGLLQPICLSREWCWWDEPLPGMSPLWTRTTRRFEIASGFLSGEGIKGYLAGEVPDGEALMGKEEFYTEENRVIISLTGAGTTREGYFYAPQFLRLTEGTSFACDVEVEGDGPLELPDPLITLGGERRMAYLTSKKAPEYFKPPQIDNLFKILLITPAIFKKGWRPSWVECDGMGRYNGLEFRLIAAAVGKPQPISGWDMAQRQPKPLHLALPAGSVYYFELIKGSADEIIETFHFKAISEEMPEAGFGVSLVGRWKYV